MGMGKKIHSQFILFFPLIMSAPIYYMAADWGRYLYISYISSLIILIFGLSNEIFAKEKSKNENNESMIKKILFSLIIFVYCLGWPVPICCEKNFKSGIRGKQMNTTQVTQQQVDEHNARVIALTVARVMWERHSRMATSTRYSRWNR